jgi:hypothetical protein
MSGSEGPSRATTAKRVVHSQAKRQPQPSGEEALEPQNPRAGHSIGKKREWWLTSLPVEQRDRQAVRALGESSKANFEALTVVGSDRIGALEESSKANFEALTIE